MYCLKIQNQNSNDIIYTNRTNLILFYIKLFITNKIWLRKLKQCFQNYVKDFVVRTWNEIEIFINYKNKIDSFTLDVWMIKWDNKTYCQITRTHIHTQSLIRKIRYQTLNLFHSVNSENSLPTHSRMGLLKLNKIYRILRNSCVSRISEAHGRI